MCTSLRIVTIQGKNKLFQESASTLTTKIKWIPSAKRFTARGVFYQDKLVQREQQMQIPTVKVRFFFGVDLI